MRLLTLREDGEFILIKRTDGNIPSYAILSHTWGADDEEVTFKDLVKCRGKNKAGYRKLEFCCEQAAKDGLHFFWVDTCCIDKSSSSELSEAINSMFRWYQSATKCYAYLSDVSTSGVASNNPSFQTSRWFTRGWTLQELLAPTSILFYSFEGTLIGDRNSLAEEIAKSTGIAVSALQGRPLLQFSVDERMSWTRKRETTLEEDIVYSLWGIFQVYMSPIYGEGKENALKRLQKEIQEISKYHPKLRPQPPLNLPYNRDPDFVDRADILDWVDGKCTAQSGRAALVGLGGVGKSQVAIQHCYNTRVASPYIWVFWVHAGTPARFEEGYRRIAEVTKLDGWDNPRANVLRLVRNWLCDESSGGWIMVVDNADDLDVFFPSLHGDREADPLFNFLPQSPNGSILITSRSRDVAFRLTGSHNLILEVKPMTGLDAFALLKRKLGFTPKEEDAAKLLHSLDYMPLAITQAASYIAQRAQRMSVPRYLSEFCRSDRNRSRLLGNDVGDSRRDGSASNSIITTWQISFEYIRGKMPSAARLLSLMSLFDRQGIPERLLYDRYTGDSTTGEIVEGAANFEDDIHALISFSLVEMSADGSEFEMHRLVQFATKQWLELNRELDKWYQTYSVLMDNNFPIGRHENWTVCQALLPHARAAEACKPKGDTTALEAWASVLFKAAWYSGEMGQYEVAKRLGSSALDVRENILGAEHPDTLKSLDNLGMVLNWQGAFIAAEATHLRGLEASRRVLGAEHPDTLSCIDNLAITLWHQGRWAEAESLQLQLIKTRTNVFGVKHPDTLNSMVNLASTYRKQGRWTESEELDMQVIGMSKKLLGAEHPDTLSSMNNLASTYGRQGRWTDAEELCVNVMETRKIILGAEHPDTLTSIANLASTYRKQGRWADAEGLQVQVTETRKRVLGAEHPQTLTGVVNLALIYVRQGRWTDAEKLWVKVMETRKRVLGAEHPDTLNSIANLASTYRKQGRWADAEGLQVQVMETRKRVLGAEHPQTLTGISNLALTYKCRGRLIDSEKLGFQVMETRKRVLGDTHPDTLNSISRLASTYRDLGRWAQAEWLEVQAMETRKRLLGAEHPNVLISIDNLALTYRKQGRWIEAEELGLRVTETRRRVLGHKHPDTLNSMSNLASTYRDLGRWAEAEDLEAQVMRTRKRLLGPEHPDTLTSVHNLAAILGKQGQCTKAEELEVEVLEARKKALGTQHPDTLSSLNALACIYRNKAQWSDAEELLVQVVNTRKRVLGAEHPDTLGSIANLASIYWNQGRWLRGERLEVEVMETRKKVLGKEHPDTMTSMENLAYNLQGQDRINEAIYLLEDCLQIRNQVFGRDLKMLSITETLSKWKSSIEDVGENQSDNESDDESDNGGVSI